MDNQKAEELGYYAEDYEDSEALEDMEDDLYDDESIEAFGEDDLDDDEAFEAEYDDDDEAIEAYWEDDLDDDEALAFEYDDDDEGMEYDDDDEAFDEVYFDVGEVDEAIPAERSRRSRRARQRAIQLAKLRASMRRRKARDARRKALRNARRTQKMLSNKLRAIRRRGRVSLPRISKVRGTGYVTAILPNGRRTKMMFRPALATRTDVNRLTRQISANGVKQAKAIRVQARNIKLLKSAQSSAVKSLTAQHLKSTKLLTKQITDGDKNLDKRITKLVRNQKKSGRKHDAKMLAKVRDQQRRSTWNSVLIASTIPLFAAYGDRAVGDDGNPITKKNAIIAGSTAVWLFADDLVYRFLTRGKKWHGALNIWNYAAPVGNALTVWFFMKNRQHERFVTGVTPIRGRTEVSVGLVPVGEDHGFDRFSNPPVIATLNRADAGVRGVNARVDQGTLKITLLGSGNSFTDESTADVAWQVDTLDPKYKRKSGAASQ